MDNQLPKPLIILIAFFQGIALTILYQSVEHSFWPSTNVSWLTALVTFTISFPLLMLFTVTKTNALNALKMLLPFSLLLSVIGGYVGYQQEPQDLLNNEVVIVIFCFTALIASFKALMYAQQLLGQQKISYSVLFALSWRNAIIFAECWLFVGIFFGILHLGAGLFSVLEIDFFRELLKKDWFVIPSLNLAFGFGIIVFRNIVTTADNISTILQTLIKFLLPALTIVSLGFIVTLPFTGLETLWQTGAGSLLLMWLQALTLFFVNAVFQDASHEHPYPKFLHRLIFVGVAILPIYSAISFYGLWLRIDQYGLTVDRCWAVLICLLLSCFSLGYLVGIIKKRDAWLETLSRVNISMGLVVLVVMLLVNTPLLNFQSLSTNSQIARLNDGKTNYNDFDYNYFKWSLGRQGYQTLQSLKTELETAAPDKVVYINRLYVKDKNPEKRPFNIDEFKSAITYWPAEDKFPDALVNRVYADKTKNAWANYRGNSYYFVTQDLNGDDKSEFIVIEERNSYTTAKLWTLRDQQWHSTSISTSNPDNNHFLRDALLDNQIETIKPKFNDLKIGNLTFRVAPRDN